MCHRLTNLFAIIVSSTTMLSTSAPTSAGSQITDRRAEIIKEYRERQNIERLDAQKDKAAIEAHIRKVKAFRAGLELPKESGADEKARMVRVPESLTTSFPESLAT